MPLHIIYLYNLFIIYFVLCIVVQKNIFHFHVCKNTYISETLSYLESLSIPLRLRIDNNVRTNVYVPINDFDDLALLMQFWYKPRLFVCSHFSIYLCNIRSASYSRSIYVSHRDVLSRNKFRGLGSSVANKSRLNLLNFPRALRVCSAYSPICLYIVGRADFIFFEYAKSHH